MNNLVNQVTKKGKPSALAMKRFESEIKRIADNKISEVKLKYPLKNNEVRSLIIEGKGKLRSPTEIRTCIKTRTGTYSSSLDFSLIFDLSKDIELIKQENEESEKKRDVIISKISDDVRDLINSVYFGESNLFEVLKEFGEKKYI